VKPIKLLFFAIQRA